MIRSRHQETCCLYQAVDDPEAHHARATAAGAEIVFELTDQPYESRTYAAPDPEGNIWAIRYLPTRGNAQAVTSA
jgi:uncharacterized glyoxalase superfamily protein PhnB